MRSVLGGAVLVSLLAAAGLRGDGEPGLPGAAGSTKRRRPVRKKKNRTGC